MGATPPDPQPQPQPPTPQPPEPTPAPQPPAPAPTGEEPLGAPGLRALQAERERAAAAERELAAERAKREELERAQMSEQDRLKREAEEGRKLAAMGATAMKSANLLTALAHQGLVGPAAMAASKLIDGLEYDEAYQPKNLEDRLAAAKQAYGEQYFAGATPAPAAPAPPVAAPNGGNGGGHPPLPTSPFQSSQPQPVETHSGPRPGPALTEDEQFERFFQATWPGMLPPTKT